ncbi:hypothetical protein IAU60_001167 [Kwoniella sp. DSM 27419]
MPRKAAVDQSMYIDEAEGFILEHALFSPPRTWPPLAPDQQPQANRLASSRKKMDWEEEVRTHPDEPIDYPIRRKPSTGAKVQLAVGDEAGEDKDDYAEDDVDGERCVICLMGLRDRTILGVCGHEFCFECLGVWANQSRRCPLCSADMAPFLLHDLDAEKPTKFYLPPLPTARLPSTSRPATTTSGPAHGRLAPVQRQRQEEREKVEPDELDLQVERRKEIYRYELYAKHIGSNPTTRFRPSPGPRQIAEDPTLIQRATAFLRRELRVWTLVDVEFLTTYILSLLKTIDIRSEPAIRLLADFLDPSDEFASTSARATEPEYPRAAEHFAHELCSFLRSPFKELRKWDEVAQYDPVPRPRSQRSNSPLSSRSRSCSRSVSRSPSPRSESPISLHSRSRSRSRDRARRWSRRDTFVPSLSPDAKRWNEHDSWLDPEYAAWLDEEKRRDEERRDRKRARRASELDLPDGSRIKMRAWGQPEKRAKVELLPVEEPALPLRMDVVPEQPAEVDNGPASALAPAGLAIRGKAKSTETVSSASALRLTLLERLAQAKAQAAVVKPAEPTVTASVPANKAKILERLAKAKAEAAARVIEGLEAVPPLPAQAEEGVTAPPPLAHSVSDPTSVSSTKAGGLRAIVRARLALKLKLESEKASLKRNVAESKAQELRRMLLEAKARREAEQVASNYGGMDQVLRKMDPEERKREVRRRLMRLKMMEAETDGERRTRELKEKLLAKKRGKVGAGVPVPAVA